MTSQENRIFIVGSMKSGTTSLHDYLVSTGKVFSPVIKEPQFITWEAEQISNLSGDAKNLWNMVVPVKRKDVYEEIYTGGEDFPYLIDSSVFNLPSADSCNYIKANYPNSKIIILVRDPVARMISSYNFQRSKGVERFSRIHEAIEDELRGNRDDYPYSLRHVFVSHYAQHIPLYIENFDDVLILKFNDMVGNLPKVRAEIQEFLDLDLDLDYSLPKSNETMGRAKTGLGLFMSKFIFTDNRLKYYLKLVAPIFLRKYFSEMIKNNIRREGHETLSADDIVKLREIFKEDYEYLNEKLGVSF